MIPDATTIWFFRDWLIWAELQRQLDGKGLRVQKGVSQDASFITANPGSSSKPRSGEAETRRSRDVDWAKRRKGSTFDYKLRVKADNDHGLVRCLEMTPASVHDSRVDLSLLGEVVYWDKGYQGVTPRGWDATMRRGAKYHPLSVWDRMRNRRINNKRAPVERVFAVLKRVFGSGHVLMTSASRVRIRMVFACLYFNLVRLRGIAKAMDLWVEFEAGFIGLCGASSSFSGWLCGGC